MLLSFAEKHFQCIEIKAWSLDQRKLIYTIEENHLDDWAFGQPGTTTENKLIVFISEWEPFNSQRIGRKRFTICSVFNLETGIKEQRLDFNQSPMHVLAVDNNESYIVISYEEKLAFISLANLNVSKKVSLGHGKVKLAAFNTKNDRIIALSETGQVICLKL